MKFFRTRAEGRPALLCSMSGIGGRPPSPDPLREARWRRSQRIVRELFPRCMSTAEIESGAAPAHGVIPESADVAPDQTT